MDLLSLSMPSPSGGLNHLTTIKSCKQPSTGTGCCADMIVAIGHDQERYSSGDGLGNRLMEVEITSAQGIQQFPFDT